MKISQLVAVLVASSIASSLGNVAHAALATAAATAKASVSQLKVKFTAFSEVGRANASSRDGARTPSLSIVGTGQYISTDARGEVQKSDSSLPIILMIDLPAGKDALTSIDNSLATSCLQMAMLAMSNPSKYSLLVRAGGNSPTISLVQIKEKLAAVVTVASQVSCALGGPDAPVDFTAYLK